MCHNFKIFFFINLWNKPENYLLSMPVCFRHICMLTHTHITVLPRKCSVWSDWLVLFAFKILFYFAEEFVCGHVESFHMCLTENLYCLLRLILRIFRETLSYRGWGRICYKAMAKSKQDFASSFIYRIREDNDPGYNK